MKAIWSTITLSLVLAACSSTPMQPTQVDTPTTPSATSNTQSNGASTATDPNAIKEVTIDNSKNGVNPLLDPNSVLSKRNIYFDYNSDAISAQYNAIIEAHAKYLTAHPEAKVLLQGNTDERGTREYNLSLGQRRSVSVKSAMNVLGVSDNQIETVSYGEERAKQDCKNDDCFQLDRRVDIVYSGE